MNVFILTQEDAFYIPKLLNKFIQNVPPGVRVVGAAVLKGEIAAKNIRYYVKFLGPVAFAQQSFYYAAYRAMDLSCRVMRIKALYSVAGALRTHAVPVFYPDKINTPEFLRLLESLDVSLIVSVACPQIVRKDLLEFPEYGCINIHGALLPKYRGRMPSFWVLANGETKTGVTVHYMNEKVDDGPILVQKEVPILPDDTLHSLVLRSKVQFGGLALAEAVAKLAAKDFSTADNDSSKGSYFSAPTAEAVAEFHARGRRFR